MMVMRLLSTSPRNGVELMDGVEQMTRGWWRPTPGSIYPLLDAMTKENLVKKREDGRYLLTAQAKEEIEVSFGSRFPRPQTTEDILNQMNSFVSFFEDMDQTGNSELEPHRDTLREMARRLAELGSDRTSDKKS